MQLLPAGDPKVEEAKLEPLDLAASRAGKERLLYSADEAGEPVVYTNELGRITGGSKGPEIPPKARPMVSWVTGVAVGVGDHKVSIVGDEVRIDDELVTGGDRSAKRAVPGMTVQRWLQTTTITTETGHTAIVEQQQSTLDVVVDLAGDDSTLTGLLGDAAGDPENDLMTRDGRTFGSRLPFDDLYGEYVASWHLGVDHDFHRFRLSRRPLHPRRSRPLGQAESRSRLPLGRHRARPRLRRLRARLRCDRRHSLLDQRSVQRCR